MVRVVVVKLIDVKSVVIAKDIRVLKFRNKGECRNDEKGCIKRCPCRQDL